MIAFNGKKLSAKKMAQKILSDKLDLVIGNWFQDPDYGSTDMTEREQAEVQRQLYTIGTRMARNLKSSKDVASNGDNTTDEAQA